MPPAQQTLFDVPDTPAGSMEHAHRVLNDVFGYKAFRLHQADIIETMLADGDVLALMPTGGGKSLCYQIPALVRAGTGVIVSPLIALMQDQVDALRQAGVKAAFLNSTQSWDEQQDVLSALNNGGLDLIYVAPERLVQDRTLDALSRVDLALFAIDEAHCVSQWGHDFRPEYRQLKCLATRFPNVPRIALTATADERTREEIVHELHLQKAKRFVASFDRKNIRYQIAEAGSMSARERLWRFIESEHAGSAGIVYCLSRRGVEETAAFLRGKGRTAFAYHAGLSNEDRQAAQSRFLAEDGIIIVATIAFGMGIDKPDVRFVAHLNLPKSVEAYYQETGRAGRDGAPADAWMAYGLQDVVQQRQWIAQSEGSDAFKQVQRQKLDALIGMAEMAGCRRQALLAYFSETLAEPCGNCDNCLNPPETVDGTVLAQKALSTVYRTGQRFGVGYLIDVLTGKESERLVRNGHDLLPVFGIGKDCDAATWRALFRQLVAAGHLCGDSEGHGTLALTERARPVLRGEDVFTMRKLRVQKAKTKSRRSGGRTRAAPVSVNDKDRDVFEALKAKRLQLSKKAKVPPYVICHDRTLVELAERRPVRLSELGDITGLGASKIKRYGKAFLKIIAAHPKDPVLDNRLSASVNETLKLHLEGLDADKIAEARAMDVSAVMGQFAEAIEAGLVSAKDVLALEPADVDEVHAAFERLGTLESGRLGPVHSTLDGRYDIGTLKCLLAELL